MSHLMMRERAGAGRKGGSEWRAQSQRKHPRDRHGGETGREGVNALGRVPVESSWAIAIVLGKAARGR